MKRWPLAMWYNLLNVAVLNALIIFSTQNPEFEVRKTQQVTFTCTTTTTSEGIDNSAHKKPIDSDYKPTINCICGNGTLRGQKET